MTATVGAVAPPRRAREVACPYLGLLPFSEDDHSYFFGRDADREIIAANLIASRLTLLYAPSGVGKTSVLLAGVVNDLRALATDTPPGTGPEYLPVIVRRWSGDDPIAEIEDAIARAAQSLPEPLPTPARHGDFVERLRAWSEQSDTLLLLLFDQFEEFLLYHGDSWEQGGAAREIARAMSDRSVPANFLLGLREDALASLDRFKGRVPHLFDNYLRLEHLDVEAGREAIVGPLQRWNLEQPDDQVEIEPELVEAVLDQVATGRITLGHAGAGTPASTSQPGVEAPFLQLVLMRLWQEEREHGSAVLRRQTLERLGGSANLVRGHLDAHMHRITKRQRDIAAAVFHQLVTPSGTKVARSIDDLAAYTGVSAAEIGPVLQTLARGEWRIVRAVSEDGSGSPTYEIFHDVLAEAVLDWRVRHEERCRRARLIRTALAITVGAALVAALAIVLIGVFKRQADDAKAAQRKAEAAQRAAQSARLASDSRSQLGFAPRAAVAIAAKAVDLNQGSDEAVHALRTAVAMDDLRGVLDAVPGLMKSFKVSPDGRRMALAASDGLVRIWALTGPSRALELPKYGGGALTLAFSPDGRRIATGSRTGGVKVWSVRGGPPQQTLRVRAGRTTTVRWSPDGDRLVTIGPEGTRFWALSRRRAESIRLRARAAFGDWSPGGGRFATTTEGGTVRVWSRSGRFLARVPGRGKVSNLAFAPDGSTVRVVRSDGTLDALGSPGCEQKRPAKLTAAASFSDDGRFAVFSDKASVQVLELGGCRETTLRTPPGVVTRAVALSANGRIVVAAGTDGAARVWDVETRAPIATLVGDWRTQALLVVRPARAGGHLIFTATDDGLVRQWQVGALPVVAHWRGQKVIAASLSASGRGLLAATASGVRRAGLRRPGSGARIDKLRISGAAFAPGGRALAVRSGDQGVRIIHVGGNRTRWFRRPGRGGRATSLAFSTDGKKLVTAYADGIVQVRDAAHGALLRTLGSRHAVRGDRPYAVFAGAGEAILVADKRARVYDSAGQVVHRARLRPPRGERPLLPPAAAYGGQLAAAFGDAPPQVWDARRWPVARELEASSRQVTAIAVSPDGRVLATAATEGIRLWDARSLRPLSMLTAGPFTAVSFSRDGKLILAAGPKVGAQVFACRACGDTADVRATARGMVADALLAVRRLPAPARERPLKVPKKATEPTAAQPVEPQPTPAAGTQVGTPAVPALPSLPAPPAAAAPPEATAPDAGEGTRRSWGGSGRFRTQGDHSGATVRG